MTNTRTIWKVRAVKPYPEAHNHLLIGQLLHRDDVSVGMLCRTYHFGRAVHGPKDIRVGALAKRIIPWSRIEIVNELPASFDFQAASLHSRDGETVLRDGNEECLIASGVEARSY